MSRRANPWDNAACESFLKTLKSEEVSRIEYRDLAHARSRIRAFLETIYNRQRLHSTGGPEPFVHSHASHSRIVAPGWQLAKLRSNTSRRNPSRRASVAAN
jgi:transposase InsO family protein